MARTVRVGRGAGGRAGAAPSRVATGALGAARRGASRWQRSWSSTASELVRLRSRPRPPRSRPPRTTARATGGRAVYRTIQPSLVLIQASGADGSTSLGSGVIVNRQGQVMTADHVIDGATDDPGHVRRRHRAAAAQVVSSAPDRDIAVLATRAAAERDRARRARRRREGRRRHVLGRQPARARRLAHRGRRVRPRPVDRARGRQRPARRAHPVRRRGQPGELGRTAARTGRARSSAS